MVIPPDIEAQILRYYHAEKWKIGTIAAQLHIHHGVVRRVIAQQAGLPQATPQQRPSHIDAYLPFILQTLEKFPKLTASRLYVMVRERGYPHTPLLRTFPKVKALVTMWERRMELEGFAPVMETVRNNAAGLKGRAIAGPHDYEQIPALVERGRQRVADFFDDLEARLATVSFVAGDRFSVADITAVVAVDFAAKALSLTIPEAHVATKAWYAQFSARPSMAAKYCRRRPPYIPPFQEFHHGSTNRQNPRP